MVRSKQSLQFNTAIITYPSNYDNLLTIELIEKKFKEIISNTTKLVIAREDPDEEINRIHYHVYYDNEIHKNCTTKYFDIPLPEPVVVFVKQDKTRTYQLLADLASKLGGDNEQDMVPLLDQYVKDEMEEGTTYDILSVAHPNIQLKKDYYGDKYIMLRYVNKQKLLSELGDKFQVERIDEELKYLEENKEKLDLKIVDLTIDFAFKQLNVATTEELIHLLRKYKLKLLRKMEKDKRSKGGKKKGISVSKYAKNKLKIDVETEEFRMFLREKILEKRLTKQELIEEITKDKKWWPIYCGSYINYSKLINDMFRGKPPAKPTRHYEYTFWIPNKLYDYLVWLDQWVENWFTGKPLEHRPKGLCLIGPSRTGKTTLISCMGTVSYFKNVWNMDCWEGKAAFNVMDDMDAGDEGKGLSFCWYKPFFGAQDAITITDKFKPKQDIYNGKPLIWLNNFRLEDSFQSKTAWDYIQKNMVIVHIERPFTEPPTGMDIYQYKEFDPKSTWFYKNVVLKEEEEKEELQPLNERKRKLQESKESTNQDQSNEEEIQGRPSKRITIEN